MLLLPLPMLLPLHRVHMIGTRWPQAMTTQLHQCNMANENTQEFSCTAAMQLCTCAVLEMVHDSSSHGAIATELQLLCVQLCNNKYNTSVQQQM